MNTQELARELRHPGAQELLRSGSLARLAYNGHDGLPPVIPIGFYWNGERIVVCTAPTSPKVRALSSRLRVGCRATRVAGANVGRQAWVGALARFDDRLG